jgi:hypothetical protein
MVCQQKKYRNSGTEDVFIFADALVPIGRLATLTFGALALTDN